ncbi:unnamed protein product [Schistosoma curassoni]|uniref:Uncharacterized protein n=1 Tax=Schistosoma curassoni TaxID=6186 RepID=A0A183JFC3_9TREM|nr:unnamed protein product [Schistosoma curassoni]
MVHYNLNLHIKLLLMMKTVKTLKTLLIMI